MRKSFIRNLKFFDSKSNVIGVAGVSTVLALGCLCGCSSKKSDEFIDAPDIVIDSLEDDLSFEDESSNDSVVTTYENYLDFFKNSTTHTNVSTGAFGNKKKPDGRQKNIVDGNQLTTNDIISKRSSDGEIIRDISGKNSVKETNASLKTSLNGRVFTTKTTTVTEAIVTETEPETEVQTELQTEVTDTQSITPADFVLDQIGNRRTISEHFSSMMLRDLKANSGVDRGFYEVDFGYGYTDMYHECIFALNSLNKPYYNNDNIISGLYKFSTADDLVNYKQFLYSFKYVQDYLNSDIDYSKYIIDENVSYLLQGVDDASRNGYLDDFMVNNIDSINLLIQDYPGLGAIVFSYENGKYLNFDAIDNSMNDFINHICEVTYGYSYSK